MLDPHVTLPRNTQKLLLRLLAVSHLRFKLTEGKISPQDMVTGRIPLEKTYEDGFLELIHNKDQHIKILVSPTLAS